MTTITEAFRKGRKALIAYVTVGYPSLATTAKIVPKLAGWGCDIIELGIPFSDPLADGATIQRASFQALHNGVSTQTCLDTAASIRKKTDVPLVFMTYFNPILAYGLDRFVSRCSSAGISGLVIPDLPPEEGGELIEALDERGIDLIFLLAPTSSDERIQKVAGLSKGFIYVVSVTGVTGTRTELPAGLEALIGRIRERTTLPLCVGFGVSTAEQVKKISRFADGVIVGSRLVEVLEKNDREDKLRELVDSLRRSLDAGGAS